MANHRTRAGYAGALFVLLLALRAVAQAPDPVPYDPQFAPAYIFAGPGHSDTIPVFASAGYAKKTGEFNVAGPNKFPIYTYGEVRAYRQEGKQITDFLGGVLLPFYAKRLAGFDIKLAIGGNAGVSTSAANIGYSLGAKVVADVTRAAWKTRGFYVAANPTRSSIGGVHASEASAGVRISFAGF